MNPVAGPYFDISVPEPTGVVATIVAPQDTRSAGSRLSAIAPGAGRRQHGRRGGIRAVPASSAISLAEVIATSDVPGGVVNILDRLAGRDQPVARLHHADVHALDLVGAGELD